jgi:demethylmenaquinone methyltransferase/2-methoxy-6-polyprenyl-1,4-benzoquinol methylase
LLRIPNPGWRLVYGLMATYGLRNHEVFFTDVSALADGGDRVIRVLPTTKTGEHQVWPFHPEWVDRFNLTLLASNAGALPPVCTDLRQTTLQQVGRRVAEQFRRYDVPLTPYDLRHAWAVRTIHIGLPDTGGRQDDGSFRGDSHPHLPPLDHPARSTTGRRRRASQERSLMTSPLRQLAYRYRWIYDTVTGISALSVGGVDRLRSLGLAALDPVLPRGAKVLDFCCGSGEAAAPWIEAGFQVTGLDVSPKVLELAATRYPLLTCIEGLAEDPPCAPASFDAIQISLALHEFRGQNASRCCCPVWNYSNQAAGWWWWISTLPGPLLQLPQQLFCALFETETAIALLEDDIPKQLEEIGFATVEQSVLAGAALQRITAAPPLQRHAGGNWRCHELGSNVSRKAIACGPISLGPISRIPWHGRRFSPRERRRCLPKAHGTPSRRAAPTGLRESVEKDWSWSSPATARERPLRLLAWPYGPWGTGTRLLLSNSSKEAGSLEKPKH